MRAARWTLLFASTLALGLTGARFLALGPSGSENPTRPDRGVLGPVLDPGPSKEEVAQVPPEAGAVVDVASCDDRLAVLTSEGWSLTTPDTTLTWRGSRTPGSPGWIERLSTIALDTTRLYVLDEGRSVVGVWDLQGKPVGEISIPFETTYAQRPTQLLLDPQGRPTVTLLRAEAEGEGYWDLLAFDSAGTRVRTLSLPGESRSLVFGQPLMAATPMGLLSFSPLTHELSRVDLEEGTVIRVSVRDDPPLWVVPRRHRREYRRMLQGLGAAAARMAELPEFWPSVRDFTVRMDGTLLVAVTAGEARQHIELLTEEARPLGRFNLEGFEEPVFLSGGRAFLAEEGTEETRIYELDPDRG